MAHEKTGLLTPAEHRDLYSIPILDGLCSAAGPTHENKLGANLH
jgi:hypothetical protein